MTTTTNLASRVEAATGADRELDLAVQCAAYVEVSEARHITFPPPAYTSSLDAVCALIAEKLPGWAWKTVQPAPGKRKCYAEVWCQKGTAGSEAEAATPALALLAATLRALEADHD